MHTATTNKTVIIIIISRIAQRSQSSVHPSQSDQHLHKRDACSDLYDANLLPRSNTAADVVLLRRANVTGDLSRPTVLTGHICSGRNDDQ